MHVLRAGALCFVPGPIRILTLSACVAERDPVAGTVYLAPLGVFALMPLFVARQ